MNPKWWKCVLVKDDVDDVKVANRLDNHTLRGKYGWSVYMERIMLSQTLSDAKQQVYIHGKRFPEINPKHRRESREGS